MNSLAEGIVLISTVSTKRVTRFSGSHENQHGTALWFSGRPQTSSSGIVLALVRNAGSQTPPRVADAGTWQ